LFLRAQQLAALLYSRYGQCFVFSAVAVSVLRALGIAARPVTCYNCALETETKGRVKRFFSADGDLIHEMIQDSVWYV